MPFLFNFFRLMDIGIVCVQHFGEFGPALHEAAIAAGVAVLAIKTCAHRKYKEGEEKKYQSCWYVPEEDPAYVAMLFRWALSKGIVSCIAPGNLPHFEMLVGLAQDFAAGTCSGGEGGAAGAPPLGADELELMRQRYGGGDQPVFENTEAWRRPGPVAKVD